MSCLCGRDGWASLVSQKDDSPLFIKRVCVFCGTIEKMQIGCTSPDVVGVVWQRVFTPVSYSGIVLG